MGHLILNRKEGESIIIDDNIKITLKDIEGKQVKLALDAPEDVPIVRRELVDKGKESGDE